MADVSVTFGATDEGLEKTLKTVRTELNTLEAKVKAGGMSMTELEGTMKRIGQVKSMEKNIKAIGDQSKDTTDKVKTLGKASEEAGEKAKLGFGKIAVGATLAGAAAKLGSMAIEGAFAVAQKTVQSFGAALDMGGRLVELSDRTGIAVDRLLLLERAFHNAGVGADAVGPIINKMQKALVDAEDGTSKAAYAFADLGLSLSQLRSLSPEEQLRTIGKAIAAIPDPAQRASTAMEIFGKSGGALNQVFANFDEEVETAKRQLGSLPEIMKAGSSQFDRISDNLVVVGGKFIEFAAGLIDRVKPALDAVTTALSMIDAAGIGQEIGEFFVGAGEGMKMFQKAVDEFKVGNFSEGFKAAFEAIKMQAMETGNSIYSVLVASFKSAGQFIATVFDPEGMLMTYITGAFNLVGLKAAAAIAESLSDMLPKIAGFSPLRRGMEEFAATAKEDAAGLFGAMYYDADSLGKELAAAGSEFSENFKKNMVGVTPLFDTTIKKQEEVVAKNKEIEKSADAAYKHRPFNFVEISKAQQAEMDKAANAKAEDERAANAEKARQEKLKESAALKREEVALQLKINDAIASGNTKEQDRLKAEAALNKSIQDMIKSGMGEEEATRLANELERASRAADRTKNSLATKIGEDIKKRQDAEAVDPGGRLMKKAQEQIAAGRYTSAETTMRQIKDREADANIRGTGKGRDTRALEDIGRQDYGIRRDFGESQSDFRERIRLAREEGKYGKEANENMKKSLASTQKRMGEGMKKDAERKTEEKKTPMTLEGMVKAIQTAVEKLEVKLPQPVMV
jgi:hypothetical protein